MVVLEGVEGDGEAEVLAKVVEVTGGEALLLGAFVDVVGVVHCVVLAVVDDGGLGVVVLGLWVVVVVVVVVLGL